MDYDKAIREPEKDYDAYLIARALIEVREFYGAKTLNEAMECLLYHYGGSQKMALIQGLENVLLAERRGGK